MLCQYQVLHHSTDTCSCSSFCSDATRMRVLWLAQMGPWLGQFGTGATGATTRHDTTTMMLGPCSESVPPRRGEGGPQAFRRGGDIGRVGFDARIFPPWDGRSPVSHPTCDVPFPPRRTGRYRKGMISDRPSYQGVRRSVHCFCLNKPLRLG
jgi:hypothetical protein